MIEACLVIAIASLVFFGLVQVSQLHMAKTTLSYAAAAGARARTVGFNDFMVWKVVRTAAIPAAGVLLEPQVVRTADPTWGQMTPGGAWNRALRAGVPASSQLSAEQSRIPLYLGTDRWGETYAVLDYERWDVLQYWTDVPGGDYVQVGTWQDVPLNFPFAQTFYADSEARLRSADHNSSYSVIRENHGSLFLEP